MCICLYQRLVPVALSVATLYKLSYAANHNKRITYPNRMQLTNSKFIERHRMSLSLSLARDREQTAFACKPTESSTTISPSFSLCARSGEVRTPSYEEEEEKKRRAEGESRVDYRTAEGRLRRCLRLRAHIHTYTLQTDLLLLAQCICTRIYKYTYMSDYFVVTSDFTARYKAALAAAAHRRKVE